MEFSFRLLVLGIIAILYQDGISGSDTGCPADCICYIDYLSNLASWKWVETDIYHSAEDPETQDFNPYLQHNEVYDVPRPNRIPENGREPLRTVTCILRTDSSEYVTETLQNIDPFTQVLSIIQASSSGNITLGKKHFQKLDALVGIEIQGYTHENSETPNINLEPDSYYSNNKLKYLSLENVNIEKRSIIVPEVKETYTSKIVTVRRVRIHDNSTDTESSDSDEIDGLESQLIFLTPKQNIENEIVPYAVYKEQHHEEEEEALVYSHSLERKPMKPKVSVAFTNIPTLLHLRISNCNMHDISWDVFHKLDALKFLLLENNDLLFLPDFVFYSTPNLTTLSLSGNRILNLQTVGLAGLLYLRKMDVANNNITHLSELSLPPFPHLEVADFRYNPIEAIYPNTFEVMNSTKTLYLGSSLMPLQIFPNSFFGLSSLEKLEILNVRIDFLEGPIFKGLSQLRVLKIDGHIPKISYDAFSEISKLERLILKKCNLKKISMDAFYGLNSLIELDLSYNRLTFIPPGLFDYQVSLREIQLQNNRLTTLPLNLINKAPVKMLRLDGNPWHCSCEMAQWNPQQINQRKTYFIPTESNHTLCQVKYDKGSMCHLVNSISQGYQAKYVYEKRVSPVCETPKKFTTRNIFEVLRKELKFCTMNKIKEQSTSNSKKLRQKSKYLKDKHQKYFSRTTKVKVKKPKSGQTSIPISPALDGSTTTTPYPTTQSPIISPELSTTTLPPTTTTEQMSTATYPEEIDNTIKIFAKEKEDTLSKIIESLTKSGESVKNHYEDSHSTVTDTSIISPEAELSNLINHFTSQSTIPKGMGSKVSNDVMDQNPLASNQTTDDTQNHNHHINRIPKKQHQVTTGSKVLKQSQPQHKFGKSKTYNAERSPISSRRAYKLAKLYKLPQADVNV